MKHSQKYGESWPWSSVIKMKWKIMQESLKLKTLFFVFFHPFFLITDKWNFQQCFKSKMRKFVVLGTRSQNLTVYWMVLSQSLNRKYFCETPAHYGHSWIIGYIYILCHKLSFPFYSACLRSGFWVLFYLLFRENRPDSPSQMKVDCLTWRCLS